MKAYNEFINQSDEQLQTLLTKNNVFCPPRIKHNELLDYAINKLHGIEFMHTDEKLENGKLIRISKLPKPVPTEPCPSCKQSTLRKLRTLETSQNKGFLHCSYCGLYLSPKEYSELPKSKSKPLTELAK